MAAAQANLREVTARLAELESENATLRASKAALEVDLRNSEKGFHDLLENVTTVAVQGYQMDGTTQYWNRASEDFYGYTAQEAVGRNLLDLIIPDEMRTVVADAMRGMAETGVAIPTGELSLRRKDGSRIDVVSSHTLVRLPGRAMELFCIDVDITRHKQTEAALRASEQSYRQLLQLSPEAIFIHRDDIIFFANEAALELFGARSPAELIGMNWHHLLAPEYWQTVEQRFASLLSGEQRRVPQREMRYTTVTGNAIPAEASSALVMVDGQPAIMSVLRDIAERKKIEEELLDYRVRLEDLVRQRTAELSAALQAAQLADQAKDAFLANVSHELRTPLGAVMGLSALALKQSENPRQIDYLSKIDKAGRHLSRIINDLLDLSKIVAGRMEFEAITFSLGAMMRHSQALMAPKAEAKGLRFTQEIAADVPDILVGDPLRLQQILLNLVGNALKFTAAGGVDVRVGLRRREADRVCLVIDVEDTGVGISAEERAGLFQPFSQADASMSRKYGGTGLGLAISQRLAAKMGGDITVSSFPGSGSTFSAEVWLALGDGRDLPAEQADAAAAPPQVRYRDARVLVVDDHPMNREIVGELLDAVGITPQMAGNGREALDILATASAADFDLILMDIQMPVLDGLGATRAIRQLPGFGELPIIAMTAHAMEHEKQKSMAAGMVDHITKPFDVESFYRVLAKWIRDERKQTAEPPPDPPAKGLQALRGIDTVTALTRFAGNEARYRHWLGKLVADSGETMNQLRQALEAGDTATALSAAHAFKGRVGMLGIGDLQTKAARLEAALLDQLPTPDLFDQLQSAVEQTLTEVKAALEI
jgi:PAS domain S-box-containing protein